MKNQELIPHLFRTEYRKIVSVLCKRFGFGQIETAEDIASDTFLTAAQTWAYKGAPPNPTAWLYKVAKNKARNHLIRNLTFETKIAPQIAASPGVEDVMEIDLSPQNISDSQLQMMFAICHPALSPGAQVGLALRILCGFGIDEIAEAFLSNKETINKRLYRAREKLREEKIKIEFPGTAEIEERLENVLTTIYLLFSEGYYSVSQNQTLRQDLCLEAMRLCTMLIENKSTCKPQVYALLALMYFHASRFEARINKNGELVLYDDQDTGLWNMELISKGAYYLKCASVGAVLSKYHLQAGIAWWNTQKADTEEKWENILQLYNRLLQLDYSPVAALNRTYALSKANGKTEAIAEAEKLKLIDNQFYFALLGELYAGIDNEKAKQNFEKAFSLAKTQADKQAMQNKINKL
ncbi:RNA polymerase sigma factor [Mucilaginibacter gotjawali]|uniref:RNA polymerase sigma-70 factor (ECF subfamily) n=2 Tax=Mucilaginibacter gotjawali TaxID=1550579 RepID=A0A839SLX2_9SPHI|nr:sigma-70 family RNA polymerase sigma factor [Mucilaginibacter gotjawali]MBB3058552.1 RNA polymerase sigma-70 factor (ECF subfamily) [Mucilaginibacter gotjawali]BAU55776.1 RNA polymerase sigma factor YlaC [Mucilaginibacter gotjawali]